VSEPEILSFDCYGTLIDWETGILSALAPVFARHGHSVPDRDLRETFATLETRAEQPPYRPYAIILGEVVEGLGDQFGFSPDETDRCALAASLAEWPAFPDTRAALEALKNRYRLAIISNIDDDLFARTARHLGVVFDWVVTAEQVGSYKPSLEKFRTGLARCGAPKEKVLHVVQSLFHDIAPAKSLGLPTVWVDRRRHKAGSGATPPAAVRPDIVVPDLNGLVSLLGVS